MGKLVIRGLQEAKQAAFNGAWRGLKSQGFRRSSAGAAENSTCLYRGRGYSKGRCCFVGWLIPNDRYDPQMEMSGIWALADSTMFGHRFLHPALNRFLRREGFRAFLNEGQAAHDFSPSGKAMERQLRKLAKKHGLEIPPDRWVNGEWV